MVPTAQLVNFVPLAIFVGFYGFVLVCLWKFYQIEPLAKLKHEGHFLFRGGPLPA